MRKLFLMLGLVALVATPALATEKGPGCGMGKQIFGGSKGLVPHISAASTNQTSGLSQTLGITSGTSGCDTDSIINKDKEQEVFVAVNFDTLSQEMAQGTGNQVRALAQLMGCPADVHETFSAVTQQQYEDLFAPDRAQPVIWLAGLKRDLRSHGILAARCGGIG